MTRAAVHLAREQLPEFLAGQAELAAHCSRDPDVFRNRAVPRLSAGEGPEHHIDLELVPGPGLPSNRYAFVEMCASNRLNPAAVGLLPYAVVEWTERLTIAFAEHRKWPEDRNIQVKCAVYAGLLAHYAGDLTQPLHVTIHYDGRAAPGGKSPRSGVHDRVDSLPEKVEITATLTNGLAVAPYADAWTGVKQELDCTSHLVDRVYELEDSFPPAGEPSVADAEALAFARERVRATVRFLACLYLTAWVQSAAVRLPEWDVRQKLIQ